MSAGAGPTVGFENFAALATVSGTSQDTGYPWIFARSPERRWLPSRSTVITDTRWVFDLLQARTLGLLGLVNVNFVSARIQGNSVDDWSGTPPFDIPITIDLNPWNEQYTFFEDPAVLKPGGFSYRYLSVFVPGQTPKQAPGEAPVDRFQLGGLGAYAGLVVPSSHSVDCDHEPFLPIEDSQPKHKGWRQRAYLAEKYIQITRPRAAFYSHDTPYVAGDEVRRWLLEVDAQAWKHDVYAFYENLGNRTMGWIVRTLGESQPWRKRQPGVAESDWKMEEAA